MVNSMISTRTRITHRMPPRAAADESPPLLAAQAVQIAKGTGTICSVLKQVPNQPVKFTHEIPHPGVDYKGGRTEDAVIAYTWNHFVSDPHDAEWLLRLP